MTQINKLHNRNLGIDFLKGCAILSVIVMHSSDRLFMRDIHQELYLGQAVPLFITITFYFAFKKLEQTKNIFREWFSKKNIKRTFSHIVLPFIAVYCIQFVIFFITQNHDAMKKMLLFGGYGPGHYYVYVFIQIWILCPFLYLIINQHNKITGISLILAISILANILYSYVYIPRYDFSCARYLFLSSIAYIWIKKDQYNHWILLGLSLLSAVYLVFYKEYDFQPIVYHYLPWCTQNYPAYFYTLFFIVFLLWIYRQISKYKWVKAICWCGQNSWPIFLLQMFIIGYARDFNMPTTHKPCWLLVNVIIAFITSITPVILYKNIKKLLAQHKNIL